MRDILLLSAAVLLAAIYFVVEARGGAALADDGGFLSPSAEANSYATGVGIGSARSSSGAHSSSYSGAYQGQGQSQGQSSYSSQYMGQNQGHNADVAVSYESDDDTLVLTVNPVALAAMPAAVCQGTSRTASAGGGAPALGLALGFGSTSMDDQCTLRENIKLVAALFRLNPMLGERLMAAVAQLEGFEVPEMGNPISIRPKTKVSPPAARKPGSVERSEQD